MVDNMKTSEIIRIAEIEGLFQRAINYEDIKVDILQRGIQEQIIVNTRNELLCGYTRLAIAEELSIDDIPSRTVDISDMEAMIEFAILDNIRRRQLSELELVEYGIILESVYSNRQGQRSDLGTECPQVKGKTRDLIAKELEDKTGIAMSGKKYDRLKTIATKAIPDVKQAYISGDLSQQEALSFCKIPEYDQRILFDNMIKLNDIRSAIESLSNRLSMRQSLSELQEIITQSQQNFDICAETRQRLQRRAGELMSEILPDLIIDPEFSTILPELQDGEYAGLERNILADGCLNAICTWNGIIVDGHQRYRICKEHKIPFKVKELSFESREDVMIWIIKNQLARKNLGQFESIELALKQESIIKGL